MEYEELAQRYQQLEQLVSNRTTALMEAQESLQQKTRECTELEQRLEHARQEVENANRVKGNFLARMSHELRTPLNAVIGMSHLALQTELTSKQQEYLDQIQFSAHSLLDILNDILDFSKIEAGNLQIKPVAFNLDDILNTISDQENHKAERKGLELMFSVANEVPRFLVGDPVRLGQVLTNLVNNAIKFTEHGEIVVTTEFVSNSPDANTATLRFVVRDTGIGIPQDQIPGLFESFTQADNSSTRKHGGTGLGLAICQRLVQMMDGEITIESDVGKGSSFIFTATFERQPEKYEPYLTPLPDVRGLHVLVVDDNATARKILGNTLSSLSFDVTQVGSGQEALTELARTQDEDPYDLVLMDWKMPEMDGIEASKQIKKEARLPQTPAILMVTAYDQDEVAEEAKDVGIDAFLTKPVNPSMLFDSVMDVMGKTAPRKFPRQLLEEKKKETAHIQGARILLVEDNSINQQVAAEILQNAGIQVTIASNGKEALDILTTEDGQFTGEYDAVLMDIQMPVMDGYEAAKSIRKHQAALPIIAMTAHAMSGEREKCLKAGMNEYITKPIEPEHLFAALGKWIVPDVRNLPEIQPPEQKDEDSSAALPEQLPGIDIETGVKRIGGDKAFFKKLLLEFHEDYATSANIIREALRDGRIRDAQRTAHTIKGISGNIGADDLYLTASELDLALKKEQLEQVDDLLERFSEALHKVIQSIATLSLPEEEPLEEDAGMAATPVDTSQIAPLVGELAKLLKAYDSEAEDRLETILPHVSGSGFQKQFTLLAEQIGNFDFEDALNTLTEIAASLNISLEATAERPCRY